MHIFDFFRDILVFLVPLVVFLGVKFGFRKSCLCKRNDKYEVCSFICIWGTNIRWKCKNKTLPNILLECPRASFRDALGVNVTERVWHSPPRSRYKIATYIFEPVKMIWPKAFSIFLQYVNWFNPNQYYHHSVPLIKAKNDLFDIEWVNFAQACSAQIE